MASQCRDYQATLTHMSNNYVISCMYLAKYTWLLVFSFQMECVVQIADYVVG